MTTNLTEVRYDEMVGSLQRLREALAKIPGDARALAAAVGEPGFPLRLSAIQVELGTIDTIADEVDRATPARLEREEYRLQLRLQEIAVERTKVEQAREQRAVGRWRSRRDETTPLATRRRAAERALDQARRAIEALKDSK